MNPDGSGQRRLFTGGTPGCDQEGAPAWSPDGRRVAIVNDSTIYVMNADGSRDQRLVNGGAPAWSPDGRQIAFVKSRLPTAEVYIVNADGSGERMLTRTVGNLTPAWSPDGQRIAFVSRRDGNLEISVINADGSGERTLTRNAWRDGNPVWSPDGRKIAFESNWQVYVINSNGSGQQRLTDNGARNFAPRWSPDGRRIAFERRVGREKYSACSRCGRASTFQVYVMNADGSEARMLAQDGAEPVWSPDGQKIAFKKVLRRDPTGYPRQTDIYIMNADGSGKRNLTRGAGRRESQPVWSPAQR
jgi:Tol biopolymer transport system component